MTEGVRTRFWHAFTEAAGPPNALRVAAEHARTFILRDEGLGQLTGFNVPENDLWKFLATADEDMAASIVEAMLHGLIRTAAEYDQDVRPLLFAKQVNSVLLNERVSFELVGLEMVPKDSQELHAEVVAPLLRLLSGRPGWDDVETAYQNALRELHGGEPDDAITDAGTALQEALKQRGCSGNALGPLLASARQRGILAAHDQPLSDGIGKLIDWVSADRSTLGDGHRGASPATREDAWLTVHIVGALILRLSGEPRTA